MLVEQKIAVHQARWTASSVAGMVTCLACRQAIAVCVNGENGVYVIEFLSGVHLLTPDEINDSMPKRDSASAPVSRDIQVRNVVASD